ncbi:PD-(D/E)XK nuclease family protein [Hymenobacter sp. APR13]|uniref:PDDEXK-like family protein n=1 Tax=Hymenobacter sp. APR13 TaxID=1356852 RepID=UPI0004E055F5|nr:PD-(D/E)XK nuclease family protein [Hymenobacter sp. APR13]AII53847.1 hypothetical protein N008_17920 [Hymenobacter sp. APR13]
MNESNTLVSLLHQVMLVEARYRSHTSTTGEQFNIFQILGVESAEVRTHSAFLAELLNPKGSHGQQELFLTLFIQQLGLVGVEAKDATVEVEKHIGLLNEDSLAGGRIDICLFPENGHPIFIENKIFAADQKNQLLRYHTYNPEAKLLYLTLDGSEPGQHTTGGSIKQETVQSVSYATDIILWLELCRKEAVTQPLVRETITQYIHLLKNITGQSTNKMMTEEVKKLILQDPGAVASAQLIRNAFDQIRSEVRQAIYSELDTAFRGVFASNDQVAFTYKGYIVNFAWDRDANNDFFYGFPAYKQDGIGGICKHGDFDELAVVLRAQNKNFKRTNWWAGFVTPPGFTKVERCTAQELCELATPAGRQALVTRTVSEATHYLEQLKAKYGLQQEPAS